MNPHLIPQNLLTGLRSCQAVMVRLLSRFVCAESPTDSKPATDLFGRMVATEWKRLGARVEFVRQKKAGDHLRVAWAANPTRGRQILLLGHLDTVYPLGTLTTMPFRVERGRAFGPGTFDMKGGLVIALFAAEALARAGVRPRRPIICLWTSDEETGSDTSR